MTEGGRGVVLNQEDQHSFANAKVPTASAGLMRRMLALDSPIFQKLLRSRRRIQPALRVASRWLDAAFATDRAAGELARSVFRQAKAGRVGIALLARSAMRCGLMLAALVHLGASQRASAINCAKLMNILFRSEIRSRRGSLAKIYFQVLLLGRAYQRIVREAPQPENITDYLINFAAGTAHLFTGNQSIAQFFFARAAEVSNDQSYEARRRLGYSYLLANDENAATREFERAVELYPPSVMAHHNYGARYDVAGYRPKSWELATAGKLLIYDNLIRLGEEFYLLARLDESMRAYQRAFQYQDKIRRSALLPAELLRELERQCPSFDPNKPIRLLGYEWVTMIGHMGSVDLHMRMVRLGMLPPANYVLLAPAHKVANSVMLNCLDRLCCVVRDFSLVDELFPYQRFFGDQFIGFPGSGELAEPWPHAAARAQCIWAEKNLSPRLTISEEDRTFGEATLKRLGVPAGGWYVGLHVREGGFHGDGTGTVIAHRSASIGDCFAAIKLIVGRGGWVIRLGDKSMTPLPPMPNVLDYAHSVAKSPRMDVFLMATSRLFIGTTSGLTAATHAFGTPMLLINCISNDAQFWPQDTDFMVKPIFDQRRGRYLTLSETYRQPFQSRLINATALAERGYQVFNNSTEDICAAVAYKLDCLDGRTQRADDNDSLIKQFRAAMAHNPYNFGPALPSRPFLEAHRELLP